MVRKYAAGRNKGPQWGEARCVIEMKTKHESRRDTAIRQRNKKKQIIFMASLKIKQLTLCGMDIATVASSLKSRQDPTIDIYRESCNLLASQENMSVPD